MNECSSVSQPRLRHGPPAPPCGEGGELQVNHMNTCTQLPAVRTHVEVLEAAAIKAEVAVLHYYYLFYC